MIVAIIQARVSSTRLPSKVFSEISGKPLIWHVVNRMKWSKKINKIILATTTNPKDDQLCSWAEKNNLKTIRGSESDVLSRFYKAANIYQAEVIVRVTSDDPFKDPRIIDSVIDLYKKNTLDFAYNNNPPTFPEGLDAEVFSFFALEKANRESIDPFEREHVTQYLYRHPEIFKQMNFPYKEDLSAFRWTIDTIRDLEMAREVYKYLYKEGQIFLMSDILQLIRSKPYIKKINMKVERSAMYKKILRSIK